MRTIPALNSIFRCSCISQGMQSSVEYKEQQYRNEMSEHTPQACASATGINGSSRVCSMKLCLWSQVDQRVTRCVVASHNAALSTLAHTYHFSRSVVTTSIRHEIPDRAAHLTVALSQHFVAACATCACCAEATEHTEAHWL